MPQALSPTSVGIPTAVQGALFTSPTSSFLAQFSKRIVVVALVIIAVVVLAITAYDFLRRRRFVAALPPAPPPLPALAPAPLPPPPAQLTDAIRAAAKQKVESLCLECNDTHIIHFAGVSADGTVFAFGAHRENPAFEKRLFVCRPGDAKLTPHALNPACTLSKNPNNACGTLLISIKARALRATICAFPHQGFHAQQTLNGLPMEQVEFPSLVTLKALMGTSVDSATNRCFPAAVLNHLIAGYAIDDREHSNRLIDETRGIVELSDTGNPLEDMSIQWGVYGVPVVANQNNSPLIGSKSSQFRTAHVSHQPDIIEISTTDKRVIAYPYIDLQTYVNDPYHSNLRFVGAFPFLRPKVPLTPREAFRMVVKLGARTVASLIILPRLGYGLARTAAGEALHIKPGMNDWGPADPNLTYLTASESVKVDWFRSKNASPFAELNAPWSDRRGHHDWEAQADQPIVEWRNW